MSEKRIAFLATTLCIISTASCSTPLLEGFSSAPPSNNVQQMIKHFENMNIKKGKEFQRIKRFASFKGAVSPNRAKSEQPSNSHQKKEDITDTSALTISVAATNIEDRERSGNPSISITIQPHTPVKIITGRSSQEKSTGRPESITSGYTSRRSSYVSDESSNLGGGFHRTGEGSPNINQNRSPSRNGGSHSPRSSSSSNESTTYSGISSTGPSSTSNCPINTSKSGSPGNNNDLPSTPNGGLPHAGNNPYLKNPKERLRKTGIYSRLSFDGKTAYKYEPSDKCKSCDKCKPCDECKPCDKCKPCDECKPCDKCKPCDECTKVKIPTYYIADDKLYCLHDKCKTSIPDSWSELYKDIMPLIEMKGYDTTFKPLSPTDLESKLCDNAWTYTDIDFRDLILLCVQSCSNKTNRGRVEIDKNVIEWLKNMHFLPTEEKKLGKSLAERERLDLADMTKVTAQLANICINEKYCFLDYLMGLNDMKFFTNYISNSPTFSIKESLSELSDYKFNLLLSYLKSFQKKDLERLTHNILIQTLGTHYDKIFVIPKRMILPETKKIFMWYHAENDGSMNIDLFLPKPYLGWVLGLGSCLASESDSNVILRFEGESAFQRCSLFTCLSVLFGEYPTLVDDVLRDPPNYHLDPQSAVLYGLLMSKYLLSTASPPIEWILKLTIDFQRYTVARRMAYLVGFPKGINNVSLAEDFYSGILPTSLKIIGQLTQELPNDTSKLYEGYYKDSFSKDELKNMVVDVGNELFSAWTDLDLGIPKISTDHLFKVKKFDRTQQISKFYVLSNIPIAKNKGKNEKVDKLIANYVYNCLCNKGLVTKKGKKNQDKKIEDKSNTDREIALRTLVYYSFFESLTSLTFIPIS